MALNCERESLKICDIKLTVSFLRNSGCIFHNNLVKKFIRKNTRGIPWRKIKLTSDLDILI